MRTTTTLERCPPTHRWDASLNIVNGSNITLWTPSQSVHRFLLLLSSLLLHFGSSCLFAWHVVHFAISVCVCVKSDTQPFFLGLCTAAQLFTHTHTPTFCTMQCCWVSSDRYVVCKDDRDEDDIMREIVATITTHQQSLLTQSSVLFFRTPEQASFQDQPLGRQRLAWMGFSDQLFTKSPKLLRMFLKETCEQTPTAFARHLLDHALIYRFTALTFPIVEWDATQSSPCQWLFPALHSATANTMHKMHKDQLVRMVSTQLCTEKQHAAFADPQSILSKMFPVEVQHNIARHACTCGACTAHSHF